MRYAHSKASMLPAAALVGLAATFLALPPAAAQAPAPSAEQRARAREAYARGQQLFEAGQFEQAQAAFEEAYAAIPNPVVLLGIASAQERRGLRAEARATLERYLRENPEARDRAQVEARIAALPPPPAPSAPASTSTSGASEASTSTPTTATSGTTSTSTTSTSTTSTSTTSTSTSSGRAEPNVESDEQAQGGLVSWDDTAQPAGERSSEDEPDGATAAPPPREATATASSGPSTAVWVLTAVGGVGLVSGTVFGFLALSRQSDFDAMPTLAAADEGEAFALIADVSFGIALAGGLAAIVLYATEGSSQTSETRAGLRLVPGAGPHGIGLSALGRF